jgi:hypothetical protein
MEVTKPPFTVTWRIPKLEWKVSWLLLSFSPGSNDK